MSIQLLNINFSCNADKSANDHSIFIQSSDCSDTVKVGAIYKNSERSHLYEMEMDSEDLRQLAKLLNISADFLDRTLPQNTRKG